MGYMSMDTISLADFDAMDNLFECFIPAHQEIWLFGAGVFGKAFYYYLKECGVKATGFVVSDLASKSIVGNDSILLLNIEQFKRHYIEKRGRGLILTLDEKYYDEILPRLMFLGEDLYFLKKKYKQLALERCGERDKFKALIFRLADHCNFSCYSCATASPVAEKEIYEYEAFARHIEKLSKLFEDSVKRITFTGGDVFLNPRFLDFIVLARKMFPASEITFTTNGIDFYKQDNLFWKTLAENEVIARWTLYPVKYKNYADTIDKAKKFGVNLLIGGDRVGEDKTSWRMPFSIKGKQKKHDFLFCPFHRECATIANGIYYPCVVPGVLKHFKKYFGIDIPLHEGDFLDINKINSVKEIEDWLKRRPPVCDYCALRERRSMGEWMPSKRDRSEWFLEE